MFDSIDFFCYYSLIEMKENETMIVLTTRKQQIVEEYGINTTFTEEQMKDKEFRRKWTMYLLSIQYNVSGAEIPEEVLQEEADLIFG